MNDETSYAAPYRLNPRFVVTSREGGRRGKPSVNVLDPDNGDVFEFGPEEGFILRQLDGQTRYQEIAERFTRKFGFAFTDRQFRSFLAQLRDNGLLAENGAAPAGGFDDGRTADAFVGDEASPSDEDAGFAPLQEPRRRAGSGGEEPAAAARSRGRGGPAADPDAGGDPDADSGRSVYNWPLFNPAPLYSVLVWFLRPFGKLLCWLMIPAVILGGLILFNNATEVRLDLARLSEFVEFWERILISVILVALFSRVAAAATGQALGAPPSDVRFALTFGLIPRIRVPLQSIQKSDRRVQLWSYGAGLLVRLGLFSAGMFLWINFRNTGVFLADIGLLAGLIGISSFLFSLNPLFPLMGYKWMAAYVGQPRILEKSWRVFLNTVRGRPVRRSLSRQEKRAMIAYALASLLFILVFLLTILIAVAVTLEERLHGTGVVLAVLIAASFVAWLLVMVRAQSRAATAKREAGRAARQRGRARPDEDAVVAAGPDQGLWDVDGTSVLPVPAPAVQTAAGGALVAAPARSVAEARRRAALVDRLHDFPDLEPQRRSPSVFKWLFWLSAIGILAVVAFLPYTREVGGDFVILPAEKTAVNARVDGEIVEVFVREGDWVEAGQKLAKMSDWEARRDVAQMRAKLDKAIAELQLLEEGAKPEAIALAEKAVESAEVKVGFARRQAARIEQLLASKTVSVARADEARSDLRTAEAELAQARANLELVRTGARQSEIDAARADVRELQGELEFREDELARTVVTAPTAGRVVTPNVHLLRGRYLETGDLFCELEDNRLARAEVGVPETDVEQTEVGAEVRLRARGLTGRELTGNIVSIAPQAEERPFGLIVRVVTEIPNEDGMLRTGMTGFAKISSEQVPVWQAFSRMIVRFVEIEVWSWVP